MRVEKLGLLCETTALELFFFCGNQSFRLSAIEITGGISQILQKCHVVTRYR